MMRSLQLALFGVAAMSVAALPSPAPQESSLEPPPDFDWSTLTPSSKITWHPCYDTLRCALLSVPLDWTNPSKPTNLTISLALTSLPADVPPTDPAYRGPLLINPGGPGGSGTGLMQQQSSLLAERIPRTYDLLSWDPRGISHSTPAPACFNTSMDAQIWWSRAAISLNQHNIPTEFARLESFWKFCDKEIQSWVGTGNVARDMIAIHEAAWAAAGKDGRKKGVRYWGLSYGTVLGMTLAELWPERVERMILDGVVDVRDYYRGAWEKNIQDADAAMEQFFVRCHSVGAGKCGFAANSSSVGELRRRWEGLLERAEKHPIPLVSDTGPGFVTKDDILGTALISLYTPLATFPLYDAALTGLLKGNGSALASFSQVPFDPTLPNGQGPEGGKVIACSDAFAVQGRLTIPTLRQHLRVLEKQSRWFSGAWAPVRKECSGWEKPALGVKQPKSWGRVLKNKILFVGNEWDPVAPVRNARAMSKLWPGSGVLFIEGGAGHCTISTKGKCAAQKFEKYLETGKVSGEEKCGVDVQPFE